MDIQLHFFEQGTGFPLILLHGNGEDHHYFRHQIEFFSRYYRVIAVDTRGHGQSPRGKAPFTIRQFAEDLYAFMEQHTILKAHILGFSDGGNIALVFALNHPERVEKLILNGANLDPSGVRPSTQIPILLGYRIAARAAKKHPSAVKNRELLGLMVNDPHIAASFLAELPIPCLIIAGTHDMIKSSHSRLIAESIPDSQLVFLKGNHFIAQKQPEAFNQAVMHFLLS